MSQIVFFLNKFIFLVIKKYLGPQHSMKSQIYYRQSKQSPAFKILLISSEAFFYLTYLSIKSIYIIIKV
jgi:hypothetical protein